MGNLSSGHFEFWRERIRRIFRFYPTHRVKFRISWSWAAARAAIKIIAILSGMYFFLSPLIYIGEFGTLVHSSGGHETIVVLTL